MTSKYKCWQMAFETSSESIGVRRKLGLLKWGGGGGGGEIQRTFCNMSPFGVPSCTGNKIFLA